MHLWCYVLHGILFALHVILLLLLIHHPEHAIIMSVLSTRVTMILSICLQTFHVVSLLSYLFLYNILIYFQAIYCSTGIYCAAACNIKPYCTEALSDNSA
jgi:hypothetical protein